MTTLVVWYEIIINNNFFLKKNTLFQDQTLGSHVAAFARKLSTGSSRELPPSYSKVDLTSVGLTLNDHLNPPPTYDRLISMLESGEITSVPIHLHPEIERRMSLASSVVTTTNSSRKSSGSSRKSSSRSRHSSGKRLLDNGKFHLPLMCH